MSLNFPYLPQSGASLPPPPNTSLNARLFRPLVPIRIIDPSTGASFDFPRAALDPGADDTVFPFGIARRLGISLLPFTGVGYQLRWRGVVHPLAFGDVELELSDLVQVCRWPARVAFSTAAIPQPLLGRAGCLQFFDANFRGADQVVILEANASFTGLRG